MSQLPGTCTIELQYVNDINRSTQAVQLPPTEWEKLLTKRKIYEQAFHVRSDLKKAFSPVAVLKNEEGHKHTLNGFRNGP